MLARCYEVCVTTEFHGLTGKNKTVYFRAYPLQKEYLFVGKTNPLTLSVYPIHLEQEEH